MKIASMYVDNFASTDHLEIKEIDDAFILVGKNNTGKSSIIDAIRAVAGDYEIQEKNFRTKDKPIIFGITLEIDRDEDFDMLFENGAVSKNRDFIEWHKEFEEKFPSYKEGRLSFEYRVYSDGYIIYDDGTGKNNPYIKEIFPKIYYIDHNRNLQELQNDLLNIQNEEFKEGSHGSRCIEDKTRKCNQCFRCIEAMDEKKPSELSMSEMARMMQYKIFQINLGKFADSVNNCLRENGEMSETVRYEVGLDLDNLFKINTIVYNSDRKTTGNLKSLSAGTRSIYMLSLLQAYMNEKNKVPSIIIIDDPEIYLHPQLQKSASEVLYKLSKKNQVIFSTYSPNMIFNFSSKQIKQVVLDENYNTQVLENVDIDIILDDLGYTANDLMNVSFVFIVEGKQDGYRLPMLLEKYYSEMRDEDGKLQRISIVVTNSCTNIKTYANLKYINKLYLKDQFLMIRDSDGKNPKYLTKQLCSYYEQRSKEEVGSIPQVTPKNVLILKYYSFENYFLDPKIMVEIGVLRDEREFYDIFLKKFNDYLKRLPSMKRLLRTKNVRIHTREDVKQNMELIKTYVRGHNLFDMYYGRYKKENEKEILQKYIDAAPREAFADILDAIDRFVYFQNRKLDEN